MTLYFKCCKPECKHPRCQVVKVTKFCMWCLIFVDPQYGTCFMHHSGTQNFKVAPRFLENFCTPAVRYISNVTDLKGQNSTEIHFRHYTCSVIGTTLKECVFAVRRGHGCAKNYTADYYKIKYRENEAFSICHSLEKLGGDCASHHMQLGWIFIRVSLTEAIPGPPAQKGSKFITRKYIPTVIPAKIKNQD